MNQVFILLNIARKYFVFSIWLRKSDLSCVVFTSLKIEHTFQFDLKLNKQNKGWSFLIGPLLV